MKITISVFEIHRTVCEIPRTVCYCMSYNFRNVTETVMVCHTTWAPGKSDTYRYAPPGVGCRIEIERTIAWIRVQIGNLYELKKEILGCPILKPHNHEKDTFFLPKRAPRRRLLKGFLKELLKNIHFLLTFCSYSKILIRNSADRRGTSPLDTTLPYTYFF